MTRLIDLFFVAMFGIIAFACIMVYLVTGCDRIDLGVYAVMSAIMSYFMLRQYINRVQEY
jgi:membrane protein implicated in regulation of membrane protease activity